MGGHFLLAMEKNVFFEAKGGGNSARARTGNGTLSSSLKQKKRGVWLLDSKGRKGDESLAPVGEENI